MRRISEKEAGTFWRSLGAKSLREAYAEPAVKTFNTNALSIRLSQNETLTFKRLFRVRQHWPSLLALH